MMDAKAREYSAVKNIAHSPTWEDAVEVLEAYAAEQNAALTKERDAMNASALKYNKIALEFEKRAEAAEAEVQRLRRIESAAEKIQHWHDWGRNDEGMVVSSQSVRELWEALSAPQSQPFTSKCSYLGCMSTPADVVEGQAWCKHHTPQSQPTALEKQEKRND